MSPDKRNTATERPIGNFAQIAAAFGLYGLAYLLAITSPYYQSFLKFGPVDFSLLHPNVAHVLDWITGVIGATPQDLLATTFYAALVYALLKYGIINWNRPQPPSRLYRFWQGVGKIIHNNRLFLQAGMPKLPSRSALTRSELTNLLYFAVKFFFLPVMIVFLFENLSGFVIDLHQLSLTSFINGSAQHQWYFVIVDVIFLVDVAFFIIGYLFEFKGKSEVRSVEPTAFGWFVALICYPPFNGVISGYLPFAIPNSITFAGNQWATNFFLILCGVFYFIYGLATVALNLKSSNLTNRGIVAWGPYRIIRHPAYTAKNLAWLCLCAPAIWSGSLGAIITVGVWMAVYGLRALTEERHLLQDLDYVAYCEKVPYRFIPWVY